MPKKITPMVIFILLIIIVKPSLANGDIGLSTAIITISPFLLTAEATNPSLNETDNRKQKQRDYAYKVKEQARDDAILFLATNGEQGKTARFEAAAREVRKENKNVTDDKVARIIIGIQ